VARFADFFGAARFVADPVALREVALSLVALAPLTGFFTLAAIVYVPSLKPVKM
jgi:hypothetical protein